jgi:hypothetical protein
VEITFLKDTEAEGIWALGNFGQFEAAITGRRTTTHVYG